ncbi:MAG: aminopeptidase N, partial [Chloroflexi bacterium]|nr:aminopeptidase N [Chloroflexota bacterium]
MHKSTFLKDYTSPSFLIESADLQFILDPKETIVTAKLHIKRNPTIRTYDTSVTLDGVKLTLQTIKLNEQSLPAHAYLITPESLTILQVPDNFILETTIKVNPEQNLSCSGLYLTNGNFCTQNEPCGVRRLTYFIDRPDILTKFTVKIIADKTKYPILLSNGNLIAKNDLSNNLHYTTWQDPFPKSAYLFAIVAGKFG